MSGNELAQKIAEMLKPTAEKAATAAVTSQLSVSMKSLEDALGNKIETCIDGKCEAIAAKTSEKLQAELQKIKEGVTIKGHTSHDIFDCPTCKPVAIDHLLKEEKHRSGLLETVCKDGVCKPIIAENLWKDDDYRKDVLGKILKDETQRGSLLEGICTDETCRKDLIKIMTEKSMEVIESGSERKDESWAQKRLRERAEQSAARAAGTG